MIINHQHKTERSARLSVAPMMELTDRHCRYFHRLLSHEVLLYTEMVTAPALVRGGAGHLLTHDAAEHPCALQLGGSDPAELAIAARMGADAGFCEINLNCGCPSDRVQSGTFGAVLMNTPERVAEMVAAMAAVVDVPVTVKCRIGVDDQEPTQTLPHFLENIRQAGVSRVIIHARKAWLKGLSPKQNRSVPPLDYALVHRMKSEFPDMHLSINGGIDSLQKVTEHLHVMDGVMVGRAAYQRPANILCGADARIFGKLDRGLGPLDAVRAIEPYIAHHLEAGGALHQVTRHMLGLFSGRPGARRWRQILSAQATRSGAGLEVLHHALAQVRPPMQAA